MRRYRYLLILTFFVGLLIGSLTGCPSSSTSASPATDGLQLTILFDKTAIDPRLKADWGFAALVEYGSRTILFDTGADGAILLANMRQLGVKPPSIEAIVLSHEHYDHTGGLQALLDTGIRPLIYVPAAFSNTFREHLRSQTRLIEVTDGLEIFPGIYLTRPLGPLVEQALVLKTPQGTVVITGCAHPGVANMVRQAQEAVPGKVSLLIGGFHLLEIADNNTLKSIAAELRRMGVERVVPTHCTGNMATDLFRAEFKKNCLDGGVGRTVTLSEK